MKYTTIRICNDALDYMTHKEHLTKCSVCEIHFDGNWHESNGLADFCPDCWKKLSDKEKEGMGKYD